MHFPNYILFIVLIIPSHITGQQYNLTGSSEFATLGEAFTWTCGMFVPPGETVTGVYFYRNNNQTALVGKSEGKCLNQSADPRYSYACLTENVFSLTIPAENMTEFEQKSQWRCQYVKGGSSIHIYTSPDVILTIAIDVENVFFIPNENPLTIQEGTKKEVQCIVNSNAVPTPTISWFLGSKDITSIAGTNTTWIDLTGDKTDNAKKLECRATNNNKPPTTVSTTLNIEYKPQVMNQTSNPYRVTEGLNATMECVVTDANPNINIEWRWFKTDILSNVLHNGSTFTILNIYRNRSGSYSCDATNSVGTSVAVTIDVDVQYKPEVTTDILSPYKVIEGRKATLECTLTTANPNTTIAWRWFKTGHPNNVLYSESRYTISNVQKENSGSYSCTASNFIGTSEETSIEVDVQYPPFVYTLPLQEEIEGKNLSVECQASDGNPKSTIFWTKEEDSRFRQNGSTLQLPNIQRTSSGTYRCTAENIYSNGERGSHSQSMFVNVLYKPVIVKKNSTRVNEGDTVKLYREIVSNPLSNVSWYNGSQLLKSETLNTSHATITIMNAMCTDTKNFTLVASNKVERNVTTLVELLVFCKPRSYEKNISLGVTDTTGIEFSSTIIAYPKPQYELQYENGSKNNQMMDSVITNAVYNYTIRYNQTVVNQDDYGTFHLRVNNSYGETTVYVNVIAQRKPDMPTITDYLCEVKTARIQWESSFNGGDPQSFTVVALHGNQIENKTNTISDKGKNEIHTTFVQNLQSSTTYVFSVAAHNKHGFSLSKNISCTTLKEKEGVNLPSIAGGAVAGGITLAIIVIVIVLMFRRYTKNEEQAGKPQRLEDELGENQETDDDGLKENILYVSADTRDIDKPESAVYAAVNKKSQENNNNANVYAEVNKSEPKIREAALYSDVKPKKGFFKKNEQDKVGGKPKKSKGKKQKIKQEIADVYENSEGIAMTANADNVYSNSEHKNQSETEQRGYKNKDGLLYVEVNFGGKQGQDNPVIHGEDEKTDYATVEFPMSSALHKASGSEEL